MASGVARGGGERADCGGTSTSVCARPRYVPRTLAVGTRELVVVNGFVQPVRRRDAEGTRPVLGLVEESMT